MQLQDKTSDLILILKTKGSTSLIQPQGFINLFWNPSPPPSLCFPHFKYIFYVFKVNWTRINTLQPGGQIPPFRALNPTLTTRENHWKFELFSAWKGSKNSRTLLFFLETNYLREAPKLFYNSFWRNWGKKLMIRVQFMCCIFLFPPYL